MPSLSLPFFTLVSFFTIILHFLAGLHICYAFLEMFSLRLLIKTNFSYNDDVHFIFINVFLIPL